jgi:hypothetical protein
MNNWIYKKRHTIETTLSVLSVIAWFEAYLIMFFNTSFIIRPLYELLTK